MIRRKDIGLVTRMVPTIDHVATGQLMRSARKRAGLTQEQLCAKLNRAHSYVSELENGTRRWREELIEEWAAVLCSSNRKIDEPSSAN